jgi:hypothetical protein
VKQITIKWINDNIGWDYTDFYKQLETKDIRIAPIVKSKLVLDKSVIYALPVISKNKIIITDAFKPTKDTIEFVTNLNNIAAKETNKKVLTTLIDIINKQITIRAKNHKGY